MATQLGLPSLRSLAGREHYLALALPGPGVGALAGGLPGLADFAIAICDTSLTRDRPGIDAEAGLDGRFVPPTIVPAGDLDNDVVTAYKNPGPSRTRVQDQEGRHCRRFVHGAGRIQTMKGRARCWDSADSAHTEAGRSAR